MTFSKSKNSDSGFALISTVIIMGLLLVIALATISLSGIEAKSSSQSKYKAIARANARLALELAISELQAQLGDDRRISAPASQLDSPNHEYLVGVYDARSLEDELKNELDSNFYARSTNFRTYLVSHPDPEVLKDPTFALNGSFPEPITLFENTTNPALTLKASKIKTTDGKLAWVIQDDSIKARIDLAPSSSPQPSDLANQMINAALPSRFAAQIHPDFASISPEDPIYNKFITDKMLELFPALSNPAEELSQSITPHSTGLLTDSKNGGLKRDLNLLLEIPESNLPSEYLNFQLYTSRWSGSPKNLNDRKFSDLAGISTDYDTLPVALIQQFYKTYKLSDQTTPSINDGSHTLVSNNRPSQQILDDSSGAGKIDIHWRGYGHTVRTVPITARMRDIIYATAKQESNGFQLSYISFPVITLWNPYNIDTTLNRVAMQYRSHPTEAIAKSASQERTESVSGRQFMFFGTNAGKGTIKFAPGETKIFFPDFSNSSGNRFIMQEQWPADFNKINNIQAKKSQFPPSPGGTQITFSLQASRTNLAAGLTHYNDAWTTDSVTTFRTTKFHDWDFRLQSIRSAITGGGDCLTTSLAALASRPRPIGIADVGIKTATGPQPGLLWKFDYPQRMNPRMASPMVAYGSTTPTSDQALAGREASTLQFRFIPLRGDTDLSKYLSTLEDAQGIHDFMGYSHSPSQGASFLTMAELPLMPFSSLAQLQHLPLQDEGWYHDYPQPVTPTWTHTIGNSDAHPWLDSNKLTESRDVYVPDSYIRPDLGSQPQIDRLSVANSLLFDSYFFSTATPQNNSWFNNGGNSRSLKDVLNDAAAGTTPLPNHRLRPTTSLTKDFINDELLENDNEPTQEAHKLIAKHLMIHGAFNVNSTSVDAWKIIIASTMRKNQPTLPHQNTTTPIQSTSPDKYILSRYQIPNGPSIDEEAEPFIHGYNGYREISETQIDELARAIVQEIKMRGPFRSVAEFVNRRRIGPESSEMTLRGTIATALNNPSVSINDVYGSDMFQPADFPNASFINPEAVKINKASGLPGFVNQADVLTPLAPIITCRGDTFTIRAYGEATDAVGNIRAESACEAVVQRSINFVDPSDEPEKPLDQLTSDANKNFGRRFEITHFRWISAKELSN